MCMFLGFFLYHLSVSEILCAIQRHVSYSQCVLMFLCFNVHPPAGNLFSCELLHLLHVMSILQRGLI